LSFPRDAGISPQSSAPFRRREGISTGSCGSRRLANAASSWERADALVSAVANVTRRDEFQIVAEFAAALHKIVIG
jgi:hypothetical protein